MSIYTFSQKSFDLQNQKLSSILDMSHVHIELTDVERTIERIKSGWYFKNPGYPGAGKKAAETKRRLGMSAGGTSESVKRGAATKRSKGMTSTSHFNTPERRALAIKTCNALTNRIIVEELRLLSRMTKSKLGSGWVRKPDHWILEKIAELKIMLDHNVGS